MDSQKQKETAENKKAVEKQQSKPRAKKAAEKTALKPEEQVIIAACMNTAFLEKMQKLAEKEGVKIVLTNEAVITDYLQSQSGEVDEAARMSAFLKDDRNRKIAQEHAKEIYRILSKGKPLNEAAGKRFVIKDLVKNTTLSWSKAGEMINTLEAFGFVKNVTKDSFEFDFDLKTIREHIHRQATLSVESLNFDIQRYKGAVAESLDIEESKKQEVLDEFKQEIINNIVF